MLILHMDLDVIRDAWSHMEKKSTEDYKLVLGLILSGAGKL